MHQFHAFHVRRKFCALYIQWISLQKYPTEYKVALAQLQTEIFHFHIIGSVTIIQKYHN